MKRYKHLIFDLGGVLIELGTMPVAEALFQSSNTVTLKEWLSLPVAHEFEKGNLNAEQFAESFINDFNLKISKTEFINLFKKWPKRVFPGAEEMLKELNQDYNLSVLSNCNEIHWPIIKYDFGILKYFNNAFFSHLIGKTKPDVAVFYHVLKELKASPSDILFLDDNQKNIEAADSIGITAIRVNGIDEVKKQLKSLNILK